MRLGLLIQKLKSINTLQIVGYFHIVLKNIIVFKRIFIKFVYNFTHILAQMLSPLF